ncbi:MAG: hypothetical protein RL563_895 [Pseudomonadota bacterium]|jgi:dienelactone hydrolase
MEAQTEKLSEILQQGGYQAPRTLAIESRSQQWYNAGAELQVTITAPTSPGPYPLIIYLPGLGEDAEAGSLWRETWAKAGYVVFSLQPTEIANALKDLQSQTLDDDQSMARKPRKQDEIDRMLPAADDETTSQQRRAVTEIARNSELRYLGHTHFAPANLQQRLNHVLWCFSRFKQLAQTGQAPFTQANLAKVIVAGFELGAQTTSALAGEQADISLPSHDDFRPLGYLQLSPVVDLAGGNLRKRFQNLQQPMLVITSQQDEDPYAISSASARTSLWEFAPADMKYLLLLKDAGHRMLAGSDRGDRSQQAFNSHEAEDSFNPFSSESGAGRSNRRQKMSSGTIASQRHWSDIDSDDRGNAKQLRQVLGYKQVAAILSVSSAFIDQICDANTHSVYWLKNQANVWMGTAGVLKYK